MNIWKDDTYEKKIRECIEQQATKKDLWLLGRIGAKPGDVKSKEDLKRFHFYCDGCKQKTPAIEAVLHHNIMKSKSPTE